jgi:hypothetical protein
MSQLLPVGGFRWLSDEEVEHFNVKNIPDEGDKGYLLEIDGHVRRKHHDKFREYPLAPERKMGKSGTEKLILDLHPKVEYVVHYRLLKEYLKQGFVVTKIHRVIEFTQSAWMKPYIDFNTEKRKQKGISDFEKDFFKLMNNAVFGKTMENVRNRQNIKLTSTWTKASKLISNPLFKSLTVIDEKSNLVAIHSQLSSIMYDKPLFVGQAILDISKLLMYQFHYNYIKARYGDRALLLYTDTDSLVYLIQTENVYDDMKRDEHLFDFSEYPAEYHSDQNKKVIGKFKDELAEGGKLKILTKATFLLPKTYNMKAWDPIKKKETETKKKAKGTKKCVVKNEVKFYDFNNSLLCNQEVYRTQHLIRSKKHQVFTIEQTKKVLSNKDDKRYTLPDKVTTYPWGHYMVDEMERWKSLPLVNCY